MISPGRDYPQIIKIVANLDVLPPKCPFLPAGLVGLAQIGQRELAKALESSIKDLGKSG